MTERGDIMNEQPIVTVVDDEQSVRGSLARLVRALGFQRRTFAPRKPSSRA
jgi:FixJ family two-component response regulator